VTYVATKDLAFHERHGGMTCIHAGTALHLIPDEALTDGQHQILAEYRKSRAKSGDGATILAFDWSGTPRWLRVPDEARPVADALRSDTRPGGRSPRR
jgi:hypothetical protein